MMQMLAGFIAKEMRQTLRDPRMRMLLFVAPCMQLTLFGLALSTETRNIRLATASEGRDTDLEDVRRRALASGWFLDFGTVAPSETYAWMRAGRADAILAPPTLGLTRADGRQDGKKVQLLVDAINVTRAQGIESYMGSILATGSSIEEAPPPPPEAQGLGFDVRILFNPSLTSAIYLVPGVMSVIMCLITILLTSMSLAREKEIGTFEMIIAAPVRATEVIFGKTVPYVFLGLSNIPLILTVAVWAFGVPMRGSILLLLFSSFVFICATVCIGTFISTITRTQQQAMMGGFIYLMPSFLISGLISPIHNMPLPLQYLAYINPLTYYMAILRNIMLKGGDWDVILPSTAIMALMGLVIGTISVRRFKTTLG